MFVTHGGEDTFAFGQALGAFLKKGDTVLLYGDLGAGKSVLARGIADALGVSGEMASPTFTLMQPYNGKKEKVYHFDLYRLSVFLDQTPVGKIPLVYGQTVERQPEEKPSVWQRLFGGMKI